MLRNEVKTATFNKNISKLSTGNIANLKDSNSREVFGNMMVDIKAVAKEKEREAVKRFLQQEFGEKYKFSESFIDKVITRLSNL